MSVQHKRIDFLAPPPFGGLYKPAMEALKKEGHDIRWFTEKADYLATGRLEKADVLVDVDVLIVGPKEMDKAPKLRALISPVIGVEEFDHPAASERLILIANGQTIENYTSMAEAALMLILASLYDLPGSQKVMEGRLPAPDWPNARMLRGKTVGIIGLGQIGQALAERLVPFGCAVRAAIRTPRPLPGGISAISLDELLRTSDVVVVATEINVETRGMLNAARLATMKQNVVFVNVARGGLSDDGALARLAAERPKMRLALDVFDPEPLHPDSPLRKLPNAILTPHMVGHTDETFTRMPEILLENIQRVLVGEVPQFVRNRAIIDAWRKKWSPAAK